jgi:photosynthetic reaction center cytochrome c subunit
MMNISQSLGVNCAYCHMTRSFGDWSQSTPKRVVARYGIRMVRNLNDDYLDPLHGVFPAAAAAPAAPAAPTPAAPAQ